MSESVEKSTGPDPWTSIGMVLRDGSSQVSYQILDVLGYGTYGCIYLAKSVPSTSDVTITPEFKAVKFLSKQGLSPAQLQIQRQEIDIHLSLSTPKGGQHPNIVDMSAVIDTKDALYLVMEYCSGGDLFDAIMSQHSAVADSGVGFVAAPKTSSGHGLDVHSDPSVLDAMAQIISALTHAHRHQVFHRDIKPENILVAEDGTLKLADFGLATKDRISSDFGCGSSFYMAPEQQQPRTPADRRPYLPAKSDVWALGIIFLNLRFGRNPWKMSRVDADPTFAAYAKDQTVLQGMFPELSTSALNFLYRVLCIDPNERADCFEAMELLSRIETIVCKGTSMEDCDEEGSTISGHVDISTGSMSSSSSSLLSSMNSSLCSSAEHDSIFVMEDDFGAMKKPTLSPALSLASSGRSWSDMADDEEMDFSVPIDFESNADDEELKTTTSSSGYVRLSDLMAASHVI